MMYRRKIYKKSKERGWKRNYRKNLRPNSKKKEWKSNKAWKTKKRVAILDESKKIIYTYFSFYFIIITKMIYLMLIYLSQNASYNIQLQW